MTHYSTLHKQRFFQPKWDWIWIFIALFIFCLVISLTACSTSERAPRAIKRIGIDPIILAIAKDYPTYLITDTNTIKRDLIIPFEITTPEIDKDSIEPHLPIQLAYNTKCITNVHYIDKNIEFNQVDNAVNYKIKPIYIKGKTVYKDSISVVNICPQIQTVKGLIKENAKQILKQNKTQDKLDWWRKIALIEGMILFVLSLYFGIKIYIWLKTAPIKSFLNSLPFKK